VKKIYFIILLILILPVTAWCALPGNDKSPEDNTSPVYLLLAQNTAEKKETDDNEPADSVMPPLPPAKTSISTEKPILQKPAKEPASDEQSKTVQPPDTSQKQPDKEQSEQATAKPFLTQKEESSLFMEELSMFNVPTANFRTMKIINDDRYNLRGMVYGEERGYIHIMQANNEGKFSEVWKSPPLNSPVRGLFVKDINGDGEADIVAYTADGNFFIYSYKSHEQIYRTPDGTYQQINCMFVENMDRDAALELFFIGVKPGTEQPETGNMQGNLVQFDTKTLFDEWTSSELYSATDMVIGNIDADEEREIILNTGEILNMRFKSLEWRSDIEFGNRLYLIDIDDDGILELVTEYGESYVKIFDLDQRREKW